MSTVRSLAGLQQHSIDANGCIATAGELRKRNRRAPTA
jgi:hypothetical protein